MKTNEQNIQTKRKPGKKAISKHRVMWNEIITIRKKINEMDH